MLEYLSGVKKQARQEKRTVKKQAKAVKKENKKTVAKMTPLVKSKINKMQVQGKIRKAFQKKAEPIKVEEEEIMEEQNQPSENQIEEQASEETANGTDETAENSAMETQQETADELGIYYPSFGKPKGKLKAKLKSAGAKLKKATSLKTDKNDKHSKKDQLKHKLAKVSLAVPRGAFLALLLLGKALEKTPIKLNLAKKLSEAWNKGKKNQIIDVWYKLGGDADTLKKQLQKASSQSLNGMLGVVATATAGASVATASPIIAKILKLIDKGSKFAEKNPKLLAVGQKIASDGAKKVQAKTGISKENLDLTKELTQTLTEDLTDNEKKAINQVSKTVTGKQAQDLFNTVKDNITSPESNNPPPRTAKNNTMLIVGGGIAILGAFMLLKKKK